MPVDEAPGLHIEYAYCHLGQALDDDDLPAARRWLRAMRDLGPTQDGAGRRLLACVTLANEAVVELREGHADRALALLDELDRRGVAEPFHQPELKVLRVRTQVARGALDEARREASAASEALAAAPPFALSECVVYGTQLARILEEELSDPDAALRVYDIAATAVVRRITQLDACMRALPDLRADAAYEAELARYRRLFRQGQRQLMDRVGALMRAQADGDARRLLDRATKRGLLAICAWCESIRDADGGWMPFGHFLPRDGTYEITATICESCRAELR